MIAPFSAPRPAPPAGGAPAAPQRPGRAARALRPRLPSAAGLAAALIGPRSCRPALRRCRRRAARGAVFQVPDAKAGGCAPPRALQPCQRGIGHRGSGEAPACRIAAMRPGRRGRGLRGTWAFQRGASDRRKAGRGMIAPRCSRAGRRLRRAGPRARASRRPRARACRRAAGAEDGRIRRASILVLRRLPVAARAGCKGWAGKGRGAGDAGRRMRPGRRGAQRREPA